MSTSEGLEPVVEDWQKALAVVAHPDDLEFGTAAAIARWTGQGKQIVYCLLTSGEAGIDGVDPAECGPLREAEQIESARIVGRLRGRVPRPARRHDRVRRRAPPRDHRRDPPAPAGDRHHEQLPRHLGRRRPAEPGRPHQHRPRHARRGPGRRQPVDLPGRRRQAGTAYGRSGRPDHPTRGTGPTPPTPSTSACSR